MKDLDLLHYFLGIKSHARSNDMILSQSNYIVELLQKFELSNVKPISTPLVSKLYLSAYEGDPLSNLTVYRQMVGDLQYVIITHPDISFAVSLVSQYMHQPRLPHLQAVKCIYRYLVGTINQGLLVHKSTSLDVCAYSNADWAGCSDTRRSTFGFCIFLGSNMIS